MKGTWLHENRPEWLLGWGGNDATFLLNFGLPEVRDYFFNIVKDYMELPGFAIYRQDFNMDPLPYWRANDADDRQGVTEMKYVEGLYAYWDRIRERWPKCLMEECASGGHRIDIETLMRMHIHQKTDYWFDDEVNQAALWSLSQYLPNNSVVCQLRELDDYSFHSCLASSMGVGWIADAKDFDNARGKEILDAYHKVRHILTGAWYPIMGYSRDSERWLASQYHRPDLEEGLILAFRRGESPYRAIDARLRGLDPEATYELSYADGEGRNTLRGAEMMSGFELELEKQRQSALIVYKRVK
jgi:alpha-galactosidase